MAFSPESFREAVREFRGVIVRAEWGSADPASPYYNEWVFVPSAPEDVRERQRERGALAVRIEIAVKDRSWQNIYEWYTYSEVRLSKWYYFIDALTRLKIPFDASGNTLEERLTNFCNSLVGVDAKWVDHEDLPTVGKRTIKRLLLPVEYYGKDSGTIARVKV
jgi:hypothetical protein